MTATKERSSTVALLRAPSETGHRWAGERASTSPPSPGSSWSLERRLPLLILGLLTAVVVVFAVAAYREVRNSAVERTVARLESLSVELLSASIRASVTRVAALQEVAASTAIRDGITDQAAVPGAAGALAAFARAADSTLIAWELWSAVGEMRYRSAPTSARDSTVLAVVRDAMHPTDSIARSPLFADDGRMHAWTVLPVREGTRTIGMMAELRRLPNNARSEAQVRTLIGDGVEVHYANADGAAWSSLRGAPLSPRFPLPDTAGRVALVTGADGSRHYAVQAALPSTPFRIVLAQSEAGVLQRPRSFLRNLLIVGVLLLAAATVAAWLMSRHVTRPLRALGEAADAMAQGDYSYRVRATGGAEMAQLANTFNAMATRIGDTHAVLAHQNAELERAIEAKTRFLAMMSHELRTPLNAIGGYAELLSLGLRGPILPAQAEDLTRISRNKDQLLNIIADILHFSRVDAGYVALRVDDVDLGDVFGKLQDTVGPQFAEKGVALSFSDASDFVRADPVRLQQILVNLLTNAFSFTPPGGSVMVNSETAGGRTRITVRDTGIGIPRESLDAIFEPFIQVDASLTRKVGGTGLGLAISRELASAMGCEITVESAVGRGSAFTLSVPVSSLMEPAPIAIALPAISARA